MLLVKEGVLAEAVADAADLVEEDLAGLSVEEEVAAGWAAVAHRAPAASTL